MMLPEQEEEMFRRGRRLINQTANYRRKVERKIKILEGEKADLEKENAELRKELAWIEEYRNMRPDHPDDERPWCAFLLDARHEIERLESLVAQHHNLSAMEGFGNGKLCPVCVAEDKRLMEVKK